MEQETVQQLFGCDSRGQGLSCDMCWGFILHRGILEQQSLAFVAVLTFGFAT
jgi:hypothetical protein